MKKGKAHSLGVPGGGVFASDEGTVPQKGSKANKIDKWLARTLLKTIGHPRIEIELWSGDIISTSRNPIAKVRLGNRSTLQRLLRRPSITFGDAYSTGQIEVVGNLLEFLEEVYGGLIRANAIRPKWLRPSTKTRRNTLGKARENIHHHYDLGNDFYRLWLDEHMVYTCAYYATEDMNLEQAQLAKMDHVGRKLRLQPGQTVIEAGCGWGALAMHLAEHFGVTVKAFNISREQLSYGRQQAAARGLQESVDFIEDDYRNITGQCDAFVSVGMLEHVGIERFEELGAVLARCLKPKGLGLIHSIGRASPAPNNRWIEKRIFPGSYPPSLAEASRIFEPHNFSILDVENLRLHYRETCLAWWHRFEQVASEVEAMYDQKFVRAWRLYLAGSAAAFEVGTLQLFQIVFSPFGNNQVPWTRRHLYLRSGQNEKM